MAARWEFRQDDQQQWHWTRFEENDSAQSESPTAFAKPLDCFLDAVRHAVRARRPDDGGSGPQTH